MRTVIVASPAANKAKKIEGFTGTTWSDLKNHPIVQELSIGNVEAILNPGNHTLTREDAVLPEGDFKLFLVPTKNKAGAESAAALGGEITAAIQNASRIDNEKRLSELKSALMNEVANFYGMSLEEVASGHASSGIPELDTSLREARSYSEQQPS